MKKSLLAGLDLPDLNKPKTEVNKPKPADTAGQTPAGLFIPLDQIQPDPDQPRKFSGSGEDEDLALLADSIVQHGILQPITVQRLTNGPVAYQIVAGERRWRAAQMALKLGKKCQRKGYDLSRIPVFIRDPENETDKLEMQMVENLARAGMSDADIGSALNKLLNATKVSKAELARRLGRSNTWVSAILAKSSPEAVMVAERIGISPEALGAGETMRMVSWSKDTEKQVVLDWIADDLESGRPYSRAVLDDAEDRYEILRRFPQLAGRKDLALADLKTWKGFWDSPDATQRVIAERVLNGAGLAEAMQAAAMQAPTVESADSVPPSDAVSTDDLEPSPAGGTPEANRNLLNRAEFSEFDIDESEAQDTTLARSTVDPSHEVSAAPPFASEERSSIDTAGMQMEVESGIAPVSVQGNPDIPLRIPGDLVKRLLDKAGIDDDLTVDSDTVLRAIQILVS